MGDPITDLTTYLVTLVFIGVTCAFESYSLTMAYIGGIGALTAGTLHLRTLVANLRRRNA